MPGMTPSLVKNMIKRSLCEIIDPNPSSKDKDRIWDYFGCECAYCGKKIRKGFKEGHIDHLVSSSCGGSSGVGNRVLSCAACNEAEKRDMPWEEFLIQKCPNNDVLRKRKDKILEWQASNKKVIINSEIIAKIVAMSNEVATFYDQKVKAARQLRDEN